MSMLARAALLFLLTLGFVRLTAAESEELAVLRTKAERGNALAQYNLGLAYIQGRLGPADPAEAFAWLSLASENGATGKALDSLLGNITDQQLTEGRHRLDTYRNALTAKNSPANHVTPKLAPRSFHIEAPPAPGETPATPLTKAPDPVPVPAAASPAEGDDFVADAFAWLSLASETGSTSKALDSVLGNITDKQLAEGRHRLETYRTALAAKTAAHGTAPRPASAEAQTAPALTSPGEGSDLGDLEKARADLSVANSELASLRASVARLEAAATEAGATITRLNAELAAARQPPAAAKPPATLTPAEKPKEDSPPAHQP